MRVGWGEMCERRIKRFGAGNPVAVYCVCPFLA